jgi:4a-hydroxytetrahydrobiopterin dehydratase
MPQNVPAGWTEANSALTRSVHRADFVDALAFVIEVGKLAEAANHHPDLRIHGYRHVDLSLSTHSAGHTLTDKDYALAQKINELSEETVRHTKDDLARRYQA